jgi:hypothetical protein
MPSLIYEHRDEYIQVLRAVDESQRIADAQRLVTHGRFSR